MLAHQYRCWKIFSFRKRGCHQHRVSSAPGASVNNYREWTDASVKAPYKNWRILSSYGRASAAGISLELRLRDNAFLLSTLINRLGCYYYYYYYYRWYVHCARWVNQSFRTKRFTPFERKHLWRVGVRGGKRLMVMLCRSSPNSPNFLSGKCALDLMRLEIAWSSTSQGSAKIAKKTCESWSCERTKAFRHKRGSRSRLEGGDVSYRVTLRGRPPPWLWSTVSDFYDFPTRGFGMTCLRKGGLGWHSCP